MNDPWSNLIQSLSGKPAPRPDGWPARRVHRTFDDTERAEPARPRAKPLRAAPRPIVPGTLVTPATTPFRCTCNNCKALAALPPR